MRDFDNFTQNMNHICVFAKKTLPLQANNYKS